MGKSDDVGSIPYERSNNIEISLFQTQGRITRKDLLIRSLLCVILWGLVHLSFIYWETPNYNEWVERGGGKIQSGAVQVEMRHTVIQNIDYYILPSILLLFFLIQAVKRVHDTNHSGKCLLIPFYNVYLLLSEGTAYDNDYGLLPHLEVKSPSYKANQTEEISILQREPNVKRPSKQLNIDWNNVIGWSVIGVFFVSVLLNLIAPWFMSGIVLWQKVVLFVVTCLGAYLVIYSIDDNHKGKYVSLLGWSGTIAILLSSILIIYGICGGFSQESGDNGGNIQTVIDSTITQNDGYEEVVSKPMVAPSIPNNFVHIFSGTSKFYIGQYEVTQKDYQRIMGCNPSKFKGDSVPVHGMSVRDAVLYCNKLSEADGYEGFYVIKNNAVTIKKDGNGYRLPTEEEWMLAAKNSKSNNTEGTPFPYYRSHNEDNMKLEPHIVGEKESEGKLLYDIYGNVCELCVRSNGEIWGKGGSFQNQLQSENNEEASFRAADNISSTKKLREIFGLRLVLITKN